MTARTASRFAFASCLQLSRVNIARLPILFSTLVALLLCSSVQPIWSQTPGTKASSYQAMVIATSDTATASTTIPLSVQ
jgi:hypothetical protein